MKVFGRCWLLAVVVKRPVLYFEGLELVLVKFVKVSHECSVAISIKFMRVFIVKKNSHGCSWTSVVCAFRGRIFWVALRRHGIF